jgi:hypothetical protein
MKDKPATASGYLFIGFVIAMMVLVIVLVQKG